jgi:hypothetical protein
LEASGACCSLLHLALEPFPSEFLAHFAAREVLRHEGNLKLLGVSGDNPAARFAHVLVTKEGVKLSEDLKENLEEKSVHCTIACLL